MIGRHVQLPIHWLGTANSNTLQEIQSKTFAKNNHRSGVAHIALVNVNRKYVIVNVKAKREANVYLRYKNEVARLFVQLSRCSERTQFD